jgi:hypothetical protein
MKSSIAIVALGAASLLAAPVGAAERAKPAKHAAAKDERDLEVVRRAAFGESEARLAIAQGKDRLIYDVGGGGPPRADEVESRRLRAEIPVQVMKRHGIEAVISSSGCDMQAARWQAAYSNAFNTLMDAHLRKKRGEHYRKAIDDEIALELAKALAALPGQ